MVSAVYMEAGVTMRMQQIIEEALERNQATQLDTKLRHLAESEGFNPAELSRLAKLGRGWLGAKDTSVIAAAFLTRPIQMRGKKIQSDSRGTITDMNGDGIVQISRSYHNKYKIRFTGDSEDPLHNAVFRVARLWKPSSKVER